MVDTEFILSIFANDQKAALQEFKRFSMENDESEFLDIAEGCVWTIEEGLSNLNEYLRKRWPGKSLPDLMENKDTRTEIILALKTNTKLSGRTIANLLGINRGIVQKTHENM
ncbi:MAG: hypothetical protein ABFD18_00905 [Syntrophomonas sp.]